MFRWLRVAATGIIVSAGTAQASENLIQSGQWRYFADTVMGGVSQGGAGVEQTPAGAAIRLAGTVSTANNGGFIQVQTVIPRGMADGAQGVRLKVRGNGEAYVVHLRTTGTRLPWHIYQASFEAGPDWSEVRLPFAAFEPSSRVLRRQLLPDSLTTLGVVAYGKDYDADISVAEVSFY